MSVRRHTCSTPEEAVDACTHHIIALLDEALSGQALATLALSGGSTPKPLFQRLTTTHFDWTRVHLFWVDERSVPPADPQSNYRLAEEALLSPAHFPRRNVHRICGELRPDAAARRYVEEIREFFALEPGEFPHFDLVHRGIGPDAHTGSLFPGEPLIDDRESIAAAVYVEKLAQWRVTLLPGALLAARHTVFLVTGGDKAGAVRAVFNEPYDPKQYPAQIASHHGRSVTWFLDAAAAALLDWE
jgi:6-phosphogluconolactonase